MAPTSPDNQTGLTPPEGRSRALPRLLAWAVVLTVLAAVFALYLQPTLLVALSEQLWACFN